MNDKLYKSILKFACFGSLYFLVQNDLLLDINRLPANAFGLFGIYGVDFGIFTDTLAMFIESVLALITIIYGVICLLRLFGLLKE